jgi:hypothetical protein
METASTCRTVSSPSLLHKDLINCRDMDNVLFTVDVDNTVAVWAPINSWEPHILYQRASVLVYPDAVRGTHPSTQNIFAMCILIDAAELTKALETFLNRTEGDNGSTPAELIAGIAREAPDLCLVLSLYGNTLVVWGIDVTSLIVSKSN